MKVLLSALLVLAFAMLGSTEVYAHGGKTDANGCHKQGQKVHCHKKDVGSKPVKKGSDGRCYPPNHPKYGKINAVKTFSNIAECLRDR